MERKDRRIRIIYEHRHRDGERFNEEIGGALVDSRTLVASYVLNKSVV